MGMVITSVTGVTNASLKVVIVMTGMVIVMLWTDYDDGVATQGCLPRVAGS
jgi:hypothetical protein